MVARSWTSSRQDWTSAALGVMVPSVEMRSSKELEGGVSGGGGEGERGEEGEGRGGEGAKDVGMGRWTHATSGCGTL